MRILLIILFYISAFASDYDNLLLRAQASMFPKIILLDKDIDAKVIDSTIVFSIVHNEDELSDAIDVKNLIDAQYNGQLGKYTLQVDLLSSKEFTSADSSTAYYFFDSSGEKKHTIMAYAKNNGRISFGYDYKDFKDNILISLFLKEKTYLYINKSSIDNSSIKFSLIFYKIAKVKE